MVSILSSEIKIAGITGPLEVVYYELRFLGDESGFTKDEEKMPSPDECHSVLQHSPSKKADQSLNAFLNN